MNRLKLISFKILGYIKVNINFILLIISFISLLVIGLKIFGLFDSFLPIIVLGDFLKIIFMSCSIFTILFLPTYPIFFNILKINGFNCLEKLALTIIVNLSIYILFGYFGFLIGFLMTPFFFYSSISIVYGIALVIIFINEFNKRNYTFFTINNPINNFESFSLWRYLKSKVSVNGMLLIIFIALQLSLYIAALPIFGGTDPWLHISIIKVISEVNILPFEEYLGAMGLHIFCTSFYYFSGIDIILIPKFFILYTFPVCCLVVYNIFRRIFKSKNLAIFGVYILCFSSLGYSILLFQFWPTAIAFIQGLFIFFLLFTRLKRFLSEEIPTFREVKQGLILNYIIIILVFTSSFLTHSLITLIMVIPYLLVYVVYFLKNYKRGFDIVVLIGLMGIFILFYIFDIATGHLNVFNHFFRLPWQIIIGVVSLGMGIIIGAIIYERRRLDFTKGRFRKIIEGNMYNYYKIIEDKYLLPIIIALVIFLTIIGGIANAFYFNFNFVSLFSGMEILILVLLALWGLGIYQNKPKGKFLWLWGLACIFLIVAGVTFDALANSFTFFSRIAYMASVVAVIGFISYVYKLVKLGRIHTKKVKFFLAFIVIFSLLATYIEQMNSVGVFSLNRREVSSIQWYSDYTTTNNTIIGEYGWDLAFIYYNYPFNSYNSSNPFKSIHSYIAANDTYMHPDNHIDSNGDNILKRLKEDKNSDVFLIVSDYYLLTKGLTFFGRLTSEEMEQYYGLDYLNRVFSAKSEDGGDLPYYWVI